MKRAKLAKALLPDRNCDIWSEVHRSFGNHNASPSPAVGYVSGSDNIVYLWSNSFKQLYNTTDISATTELLANQCSISSTFSRH